MPRAKKVTAPKVKPATKPAVKPKPKKATDPQKGFPADADSPVLNRLTRLPEVMSLRHLLNLLPGSTENLILANLDTIPHTKLGDLLIFSKTAIKLWLEQSIASGGQAGAGEGGGGRTITSAPINPYTIADLQHLRRLYDIMRTIVDAPPAPGDNVGTPEPEEPQ
jgi:hypothetical protein